MIQFTPGPSQVSDLLKSCIKEAVDLDIPSVSHRSSYFSEFSKSAREWLEQYLQVPTGYKIFYTYSATESMEIIIRSTVKKYSHHFVNGAFSRRFYDTAVDLGKKPSVETLEFGEGNFTTDVPDQTELIWVTCTETSTGAMIHDTFLPTLREKYKEKLIAVDITSSWGWIAHNIGQADIWFFSLQKCFWLPAGLAILIMSERAIEKNKEVYALTKDVGSVHNLHHLSLRRWDYQTSETPNVLGIFLLSRQLEYFNSLWIEKMQEETLKKQAFIAEKISQNRHLQYFVRDEKARAKTIAVISMNPILVDKYMSILKKEGIILGLGYWPLAFSTVRVANFPSHRMEDLEKLFYFMEKL